jgi:hypothetical protein
MKNQARAAEDLSFCYFLAEQHARSMNHTFTTIQNNLDVQRAVQTVVVEANAVHPENTKNNYESTQAEWIHWCAERSFQGGSL